MSLTKHIELPADTGDHAGVMFELTGNKRAGYQVSVFVWYDHVTGANVPLSEPQRRDLIALLQAAEPKEGGPS